MANTKVTQHVIANNAIQEAMITDAAVTPDKLHGTLDLSSKSLTLPSAAVATTQSASDNSTKLATTAYVTTAVSNLVDSAPSSLDTLNELAAALNDDASFSTTVTNSIATKLPLAGGTMTGNIAHASDFTIDVGGDIILDADGAEIILADGGTQFANLKNNSSDFEIKSLVQDKDIKIIGNDGGSDVTALALDMSAAGFATFNDGGSFGGTGALKVPVGTTAQRPSAATGQIRWNSTDGALEVYNGSSWTGVGTTGSNKVLDTFTGDGSTTAFTLSVTPANEDALMVFIDGVYQEKGDYSLSNAVLTLDTAPASGEKIAVHTTTASVHDGTSALTQQFTGDGSTTAFTLSQDPNGENNTQVFVNGVYQPKTTYSVSGTTLTFASAPANSAVIEVIMFTVTTLGNSDTVTEGVSNLYHTSARAISAVSAGNLTGLTVDTTTLKVDATNDRVGIGLASPVSKVHIQGPSASTYTGGGPSDVLRVSSSSAGAWIASDFDGMFGYMGLDDSTTAKFAAYNYATSTEGNMILGQNRMYIKSDGKVGIGTQSPANNLHIHTDSGDEGLTIKSTGNTSNAIIFDANRSGAGSSIGELQSKWNGTTVAMIASVTGSDTTNKDNGQLKFYTASSGSPTERMVIDDGGLVGIGTSGPTGNLHVASTGDGLVLSRSGYDTYSLQHSSGVGMSIYNVTDSRHELLFKGNGTVLIGGTSDNVNDLDGIMLRKSGNRGQIFCSGDASTIDETYFVYDNTNSEYEFFVSYHGTVYYRALSSLSDERKKDNIKDITLGLDAVKELRPVSFDWKNDKGNDQLGFIAQEVETTSLKQLVSTYKDENIEDCKSLNKEQMIPVLVKAIQELEARVKELEG